MLHVKQAVGQAGSFQAVCYWCCLGVTHCVKLLLVLGSLRAKGSQIMEHKGALDHLMACHALLASCGQSS